MLKFLQTTVSHDMMAPISNIVLFAEQLYSQGINGELSFMQKYRQLIMESAQLLSCRMRDLLDSNLIEHGIFKPKAVEFSPRNAINQMVTIFETQMHELDVFFHVVHCPSLPHYFLGDIDRIQQVMFNLLEHTRKSVSKSYGIIKIETSYIIGPEEYLQVSVGNNGPPISEEA
jgi:signal transduction histidine kinase